ncbi:hypothetical protein BU25DRAFT_485485 [Macroventuria anomochaeta]|uniref:Uncharacterized protein n=1 Tax=Macroventuria anomochaeta TaxID=301207 RepID=A0ACB6S5V0_9PLEO|nr:uncharacterized protein BU25DRAFT_485485 [Macroventuria anomochaeta]KAF2629566.1 hypothetical protein BU25DRAFT_485485 [Macroventuria anomochaeta]
MSAYRNWVFQHTMRFDRELFQEFGKSLVKLKLKRSSVNNTDVAYAPRVNSIIMNSTETAFCVRLRHRSAYADGMRRWKLVVEGLAPSSVLRDIVAHGGCYYDDSDIDESGLDVSDVSDGGYYMPPVSLNEDTSFEPLEGVPFKSQEETTTPA